VKLLTNKHLKKLVDEKVDRNWDKAFEMGFRAGFELARTYRQQRSLLEYQVEEILKRTEEQE